MCSLALMLMLGATTPKEEVLAVVQQQVAAWNKGDLEAFCAVYADDAEFVSPPRAGNADAGVAASDGVTRGRSEVLARYKKRYPDGKAMGQLAIDPHDVRETKDAVSFSARWPLSYPDKAPLTCTTVFVLVRSQSGCNFVHYASM